MENTILNLLYQVKIPNFIRSVMEEIKTEQTFGDRIIRDNNNDTITYQYANDSNNSNQPLDPYNLKSYFSPVTRNESLTIYKTKYAKTFPINDTDTKGTVLKIPDDMTIKDANGNKYFTDLSEHRVRTTDQKVKLDLLYLPPQEINSALSTRAATAKIIAKRLNKLDSPRYTESQGYKPEASEVIILTHILLSELNSKGGDGWGRNDYMWQREKAAILWCVINMASKKPFNGDLKKLLPLSDNNNEDFFNGYFGQGKREYYNGMNIQPSGILSGQGLQKYQSAQEENGSKLHNFELFIDAFFQGFFPDEMTLDQGKLYTNWSHRKPLITGQTNELGYTPTHLPTSFKDQVGSASKGKYAFTLDGNIILTAN